MRPSIWETLGNRIVSIFIRIGHRTTYHRVEFYGSSENSKNCKGKTCKANKNRDILSASYEHPRTIVIISFRSVVSKKSLHLMMGIQRSSHLFLPKKIQEDGSIVTLDYRVVTVKLSDDGG